MTKFKLKTKPYQHQQECLDLSKDKEYFAILLEQGLGKTKVLLDTAAWLYCQEKITRLLVLAPNGVHSNWVRREIPVHLPDVGSTETMEWGETSTTTNKFKRHYSSLVKNKGLSIFCVNVEALSSPVPMPDSLLRTREFLQSGPSLVVIDESSRIKTPSTSRTKRVMQLGKLSKYRRIMTGTPVTQSPFDLFSQFKFLDPKIMGFSSYHAFRHQYGVFERQVAMKGGRQYGYETLIRYVRLDDLQKKIAPHSYRRTKAECLDLPPKIYQRIPIKMSDRQKKLYETMKEEGLAEIPEEGLELLAPLQIVRLMRCQQILGGYLPTENPKDNDDQVVQIPGPNPKMEALIELVTEAPKKTIVWARFRHEIKEIVARLRDVLRHPAIVELHGGVVGEARERSVDRFQEDPDCLVLVGQQQSGIGVTLHKAETVIYFSNTFSYEQRYQTEDRAHRIGLTHPVVYVDLEMRDTIDERIRTVLLRSKKTADLVTGDKERLDRESWEEVEKSYLQSTPDKVG